MFDHLTYKSILTHRFYSMSSASYVSIWGRIWCLCKILMGPKIPNREPIHPILARTPQTWTLLFWDSLRP